jgi:uncharacterized protein
MDEWIAGRLVFDPTKPKSSNPFILRCGFAVMSMPNFLRVQSDGVLLSVKLQPRAAANEIVPHHGVGDELRIRVTAPPVDAAANEALVRLLVERLDCARSSVELVRGHKSRHKVVRLHGFKPAEVLKRLGLVPSVS